MMFICSKILLNTILFGSDYRLLYTSTSFIQTSRFCLQLTLPSYKPSHCVYCVVRPSCLYASYSCLSARTTGWVCDIMFIACQIVSFCTPYKSLPLRILRLQWILFDWRKNILLFVNSFKHIFHSLMLENFQPTKYFLLGRFIYRSIVFAWDL